MSLWSFTVFTSLCEARGIPFRSWQQVAQQVARQWRPWVVEIDCQRPQRERPQKKKRDSLFAFPQGYFRRPSSPVTGILLSPKGEVVTSFFNVLRAKKILVTLASGNRYLARLVGGDLELDIALLQLIDFRAERENLTTPPPTSTTSPQEGRLVFLLGRSPRLSQLSISPGIVSRVEKEEELFQVDCRANYSNTGGPVVDLRGNLIGMACQIQADRFAAPMGQNSGVTLCLPWKRITQLLPVFRKGKFFYTPTVPPLGVLFKRPTGLGPGLEIQEVIQGTPAEKAGLKKGDRLLEIEGVSIYVYGHLYKLLRRVRTTRKVRLKIERDRKVYLIWIPLYLPQKRPLSHESP